MATRKNSRNSAKQKTPPWGPMLLSFAVGAFVMFLLHLKDNVPAERLDKAATETEQKANKNIEPTFDFYTLLPEMEVVVNTPKQVPIVTSPPQATTPESKEKVSYMLQVGSFRKAADADSYRARLALLGIESKVQTVTIDNKDTWHRVQVGPIIGRDKADQLQKQLKQNKIESLLMRAKHG
ncbi:MAG: SPOR domain-containing protein [Methylophaga sp.]|nr:SPOR domain-containing protein [Methylophaga sp.]